MGFFDLSVPPSPEYEEPDPFRVPWRGTSDDTTGMVVPLVRVLARTDEVAILVGGFVAYPAGFDLTVITIARLAWAKRGIPPNPMGYGFPDRGFPSSEFLRFGLRFADGSKATNIEFGHSAGRGGDGVRGLLPRGSSGGGRKYTSRYWCEPLPPKGALGLLCEWPKYGITETEDVISADLILAAAEQATAIWPEDVGIPEPPSSSVGTHSRGGRRHSTGHATTIVSTDSEGPDR